MSRYILIPTLLLFDVAVANACSVCFGANPDDPVNKSLQIAILLLLGVLAIIMGLFVLFFLKFTRRSKGGARK